MANKHLVCPALGTRFRNGLCWLAYDEWTIVQLSTVYPHIDLQRIV